MAEHSDVLNAPDAGSYAVRGGALRGAGYAFGLLVTLASAPLLIRHLGVVDFGRYVTVIALVAATVGVTEGGLNAVAIREYATRRGGDRRDVMANLLGIRILVTLAAMVVAIGFAVAAGYEDPLVVGTVVFGAGMMLQVVQTLLSAGLQAQLRFGWATAADLLRQVGNAVAIVVLVLAGAGLLPFFAAAVAASALALAVTAGVVRGSMPLRPQFRRGVAWPLVREALPFSIATAVATVYFRLTILAMSLLATELETGYFATSFRVLEVLVGLPGLVIAAAFPVLAAATSDSARFTSATRRIMELAFIVGALFVLWVELGAELAIDVLAGPGESRPSVDVLRIQGPILLATFVVSAAVFPLLSLRRHGGILRANVAAFLVTLVSCLVLIPGADSIGGAVATLVGETVLAGIMFVLVAREAPEVWGALRTGAIAILAAGIAAAAALIPGSPPWLDVIVASLAFAALLAGLGRFPPEARLLLPSRWRGPA